MLAGSHLLTLPMLPDDVNLQNHVDLNCIRFAELLGYDRNTVETIGLDGMMQDQMIRCGIKTENDALGYTATINSYDSAIEYNYELFDPLPEKERPYYLSVFFDGDTITEDIGGELEEIERKTPGLGAWILRQLDKSPCNFMTPFTLYDEPDMFFGADWYADQEDIDPEELSGNEDMITEDVFLNYYPEWAIVRHDDPPPDISPWPLLAQLKKHLDEYDAAEREFHRLGHQRDLIIQPGAEMYVGCIAWTKGRNEIERDIGWRCCNDTFHNMQYSEGATPGAMQFEFILNEANADRNRLMAVLLKTFLQYLADLDQVLDDIERGMFR